MDFGLTEKEVYDWATGVAVDVIRQQQTDRAQSIAAQEAKLAQSAKLGYTGPVNLPEDPNHPIYSMDPTTSGWGLPTGNVPTEGTQAHWDSMGDPDRPGLMTQEQRQWGAANCVGSACRKYKGTPVTASEWDRKHPEMTARGLMYPMAPAKTLVKHGQASGNYWQARGQPERAIVDIPFLKPYTTQELHNIMPAPKYDQYGQLAGAPKKIAPQQQYTPEYKLRQQKTKSGFAARKKFKRKKDEEKKKGFGFDVPW